MFNGNTEWNIQIFHSDLGTPSKTLCVCASPKRIRARADVFTWNTKNKKKCLHRGVQGICMLMSKDSGNQDLHLVSLGAEFRDDFCFF